MAELSARESKLVQYLNEAYGKEKQLETALQAHIGMTTRATYRKRLQAHLTETKRHARDVERRVKQLGGAPQTVPIEGFDPLAKGAGAATELAGRAVAAAQGPLHAIRGTSEQERMLKNAKSEYADEHEEIATYSAIETLAEAVGDTDTARLARGIRREEQSMASFIERELAALTRAVVQAEIPASERRSTRSAGRRPSSTRKRSSQSGARSSASPRSRGGSKATSSKPASKARGAKAAPSAKRSSSKASSAKAGGVKASSRTRASASKASAARGSRSKASSSRTAGATSSGPASSPRGSRAGGARRSSSRSRRQATGGRSRG